VCTAVGEIVYERGTCTLFETPTKGTFGHQVLPCSFDGATFRATLAGPPLVLHAHGGVLASDVLWASVAVRAPSFDDAKAKASKTTVTPPPSQPPAPHVAPDASSLLVGTWESDADKGLYLDFTADGHYAERGVTASPALKGTYRWVDANTIELTLDDIQRPPGQLGISFVGDKLGIADPATKHGKPKRPDLFHRVL
jgi:hypothetical protein